MPRTSSLKRMHVCPSGTMPTGVESSLLAVAALPSTADGQRLCGHAWYLDDGARTSLSATEAIDLARGEQRMYAWGQRRSDEIRIRGSRAQPTTGRRIPGMHGQNVCCISYCNLGPLIGVALIEAGDLRSFAPTRGPLPGTHRTFNEPRVTLQNLRPNAVTTITAVSTYLTDAKLGLSK